MCHFLTALASRAGKTKPTDSAADSRQPSWVPSFDQWTSWGWRRRVWIFPSLWQFMLSLACCLTISYLLNQESPRPVCRGSASDHSCYSWGEWSYTSCKFIDLEKVSPLTACTCISMYLVMAVSYLSHQSSTSLRFAYAAWRNGLWPGACSGGVLRLQQGRDLGRKLPVRPHEWVWWRSATVRGSGLFQNYMQMPQAHWKQGCGDRKSVV